MTAPERIWAFEDYPGQGGNPRAGSWIDEQSECPEIATEYIPRATHDHLIAEAVAAERERCAKIADGLRAFWVNANGLQGHATGAKIIAEEIRRRT